MSRNHSTRHVSSWCLKPIEKRSNKELDLTIEWCDEQLFEHCTAHYSYLTRIKNYRAHALVERTERFYR